VAKIVSLASDEKSEITGDIISEFLAHLSKSKWMQLSLESLFEAKDYLLYAGHFKSSNT
jgi:hypothetical protein